MKILIAYEFPEPCRIELEQAGFEVFNRPKLKDEGLARAIKETGADVLVVRGTKVTAQMLKAGGLSLVVRAGTGCDTIDLQAARECGIYVANCPGRNAAAVAELAFGLMLALDRRIHDNVEDLKRGTWNKEKYSNARGLFGRTLGLIGVGNIGKEMIPRAHAFGMQVVAWSRSLTLWRARELKIEMKQSPLDVAAASDIVSVHVALNHDTRNLIDDGFFAAMRPGTFFINTSRAEVVNQAALKRAVKEKNMRAGLDVFDGEPLTSKSRVQNDIFKIDGVIGTHHIGASTDQAQQAIGDETLRIIREYRKTGRPPNLVEDPGSPNPRTALAYSHEGVLTDTWSR